MKIAPLVCAVLALAITTARADTVALRPDHPERYTVVKGDTLWDISARFLKDPWQWPSVWNNNEQIKNPHLIYPGDVLVLQYVNGKPQLTLLRNEKREPAPMPATETTETGPTLPVTRLEPEVRASSIAQAIPTLDPATIGPFVTDALIVGQDELDKAGYVAAGFDHHVALGNLSRFYARGLGKDPADRYRIFRPGKALRDPDSGKLLGYEAMYLGQAKLLTPGDPSRLEVVTATQEILPGDRLLVAPKTPFLPYYQPHPPAKVVHGRILTAVNGVSEFGTNTIVTINLGRDAGLDEGTVLRVMRHAGTAIDPVTHDAFTLPDEQSGLLMVFKVFDRASYGLVLSATRPMHLLDVVQTP